jgi:hypothetical protein
VGIPHSVTKTLAAASANNIALSQSPGAGAILINGSSSNRVSTTTTAATAPGVQYASNILALTTVAGIVVGSAITDSTAAVIPPGTTVIGVDTVNSKVILSQPVGGAGVGSGDTIVIGGIATLDTARRVIITSGGTDSGITFTINGTSASGAPISDTIAGGTATLAAISNLDFLTVTGVSHTGSVASTVSVGTTSGSTGLGTGLSPGPVASTPWFAINWHAQPINIELAGIVAAGTTINWSWQYTYDDPNNLPSGVAFPQPFNHPTLNNQTGSLDGAINDPVAAVRLTINSATLPASMRATWMEAGISGQ